MQDALASQQSTFHVISRALDNFKKIGRANLTAAKIRSRVAALQTTWTECMRHHATILQLVPESKRKELLYFQEDQYTAHNEVYLTALDYMNECLEELVPVVSRNTSLDTSFAQTESSSFSLKHLPPIKLPPFSGKTDEWENFRDRFQALIIDNRELSNFSRMHFLVSSVTGSARDAISGIKVTADNFTVAWKALTERFENKRRLIETHISNLYSLPKMARESAFELHALRDKAEQSVSALRRLDRSSDDIVSDILVYFITQKLDSATRRAWKLKTCDNNNPSTYDELKRFLSLRALALEELHPHDSERIKSNSRVTSATAATSTSTICPLCSQHHWLSQCQNFTAKSPSQRREVVKQFKRCFNCLSERHLSPECKSKFTCRKCHQRHHTMIHVDSSSSSQIADAPVASSSQESSSAPANVAALSSVTSATMPTPVILSTAKVTVRSLSGRALTVRALLDGGSELTFITERAAQILRLSRIRTHTSTSGISCVDTGTCRSAALIHISPRDNPKPTFTTVAYIMKSLTQYVPRNAPSKVEWKHLSNLKLADDDPTGATPIDLIIGSDLYNRVLVNARNGPIGQPGAIQSHFGWVLSGTTSVPNHVVYNAHVVNSSCFVNQSINAHHVVAHCCSLEQELHKFWEVEEIPQSQHLSPDEKRCEDHFLNSHSRASDGRYIVRLPFRKDPPIEIGESRSIAERRLISLTRRLHSQPEIKQEYSEFMHEYEQLNHMKQVNSDDSSNAQIVYIPHHPVIRATSSTTRLRVVFDASSKTTNNTSLNSHLLAGPKLQIDLQTVLSRWRQHKYVYSADIAKMYRQILVDARDRNYQRILWIDDDANIREYQLNTVTYGTASAPFLALRVLKQLNHDEGASLPLASPVLRDNIYVDDVLFGAEDIPLLRQTRRQVCDLLKRGGFDLRKWASNKAELLADIPPENHGLACSKVLESDDSLKVLGISWNPASDTFQFQIALPEQVPNTKRAILSTIARLFDPLGWVTPVILAAKVFMQQLWRIKVDWDEIIPEKALSRWKVIYDSLPFIANVKLSRWTGHDSDTAKLEIHGFSDASTVAYAAVVYLRITSLSGDVKITLLTGKSKVSPLKPMTVPRLELSAAVLLSRLIEFTRQALKLDKVQVHCWTDSTVTLAWLSKHSSNWKTFVAHRVADVHTRLPDGIWHYVSTYDNPADCASRGLLGNELLHQDAWWHGPSWLIRDPEEWPQQKASPPNESQLESKSTEIHIAKAREPWDLASRYLWWPKLVRITAYLKRFIEQCRRKMKGTSTDSLHSKAITATEFSQARKFWLQTIQTEAFPSELYALQHNQLISSKSSILSLTPCIDSDQLIRVGGRLRNSQLPFSAKHPILLADHPITRMIIHYTHHISLHAGTQLTLATLRQNFWIVRARSLVKSIIHRCVTCTRERAQVCSQLMGQLPSSRVSVPARAFQHCGIDYAGPVAVRASGGRGIASRKAYIAVFICLATRAVHLELVSDYSTAAFLNTFLRFCARRGLPEVMYSDNGTTFAGADKELLQAYRAALNNPDFLNRTASDNILWKFIPPHAPHFGGLWEAGVKSVKHHLRRVIGSHTLTFEEFTTVLCRIEACLNSRPLGPLPDSGEEHEFLTPGHFLIGSAVTTNPEPSTLHLDENRLSRWQLLRQITERFWKQWQTDYINTLQQRGKWRKNKPPIQVGSIVLIQNPLLPPCKWELGKVTHCHEGSDGLVRVVSIKTAHSEYKRPITKICLLPIDIEATLKESVSTQA